MAQLFAVVVLAVCTLFFLLTTWSSALAPSEFAGRLGLAIINSGGLNEIRAQYAGFFFAAALLCAAALAGWVSRPTALTVAAVIFGGLISGRLASLALDSGVAGYGPTIRALYAIDGAGFALTIAALVITRSG